MRACSKCLKSKDEEQFSWKIKNKQRQSRCKSCHKEYRKQHYNDNRQKYIDKARRWETLQGGKLFVRYRLTEDDLSSMIAKYDGKCWLCKTKPAVYVDHDHSCCSGDTTCGKCVRGVLCSGCNTGLGLLGDNIDGLKRAILYVSSSLP